MRSLSSTVDSTVAPCFPKAPDVPRTNARWHRTHRVGRPLSVRRGCMAVSMTKRESLREARVPTREQALVQFLRGS
jgi:hypothetical protein